jgi:glycosyltransferase involved in cell wall biosynthesis
MAQRPAEFRVAVVIPTLNPGAKLLRSLDSIAAQTGTAVETVIVDGGSADGSLAAARNHGGRARIIEAPGTNVYEAMNRGIAETKAPILYFLGAGDCLRPRILDQLIGVWPRHKYVMFYGNVWMQDLACVYQGEFTREKLAKQNICHQAIFYSRPVFARHGGYDSGFPVLGDYAMNLRLFGDDKVVKLHRPWIVADYEGNGKSAHHRDEAFQAVKASLCERHLGIVPKKKKARPGPETAAIPRPGEGSR